MNPIIRMWELYQTRPSGRSFEEDLEIHLCGGYVVSTPDYFIMARPVRHDARPSDILDIEVVHDDPDCWHIFAMAGDIGKCWDLLPLDLPYVTWERNYTLRGPFRMRNVRHLLTGGRHG